MPGGGDGTAAPEGEEDDYITLAFLLMAGYILVLLLFLCYIYQVRTLTKSERKNTPREVAYALHKS